MLLFLAHRDIVYAYERNMSNQYEPSASCCMMCLLVQWRSGIITWQHWGVILYWCGVTPQSPLEFTGHIRRLMESADMCMSMDTLTAALVSRTTAPLLTRA